MFLILQTVDLGENGITDKGIQILGDALRTHVRLHMLFLDSNRISAVGAEGLSECLKNKQDLRVFNIDNNNIGPQGAIKCIGIPKTVDNDLPLIDTSPGFGSVGKYTAISTLEAGLDVASMCETSTKVFILEVMGRHAGWIAASSALASKSRKNPPHIILFPEVVFDEKKFLKNVKDIVSKEGYCVIVASEGTKNKKGKFLAESGTKDAFGHAQLGGVAPYLSELIKSKKGLKCHWAVADYLQRSARHIASRTDVEQAYALGSHAVDLAVKGKNGVMVSIKRISDKPYKWRLTTVPLQKVANVEKKMPKNYISSDGYHITNLCRRYMEPLIKGEDFPKYKDGIPIYTHFKNKKVKKIKI